MLARLEAEPAIGQACVSRDGARLLVSARAAAGRGEAVRGLLLETVTRVLAQAELAPRPESIAAARVAWAERRRPGRWVARADAWRLSWSEAEQFTDRFVAWFEANHAPTPAGAPGAPGPVEHGADGQPVPLPEPAGVARLRPLLVELFFGEVEPMDDPGPAPTAWSRDTDRPGRVAVVAREARAYLDAAAVAALEEALLDSERTHAITHGAP